VETVTFVNQYRCDQVVSSECDHAEIAHAVTLDSNHLKLTILLANLFDRPINVDIEVALPRDMRGMKFSLDSHSLRKNNRKYCGDRVRAYTRLSDMLEANVDLDPQSIYALEFFGANLDVGVKDLPSIGPD